jgi:hypothetical protein
MAAITGAVIAAGTATASFISAGKAKSRRDDAERAAERKLAEAKEKLDVNYLEGLSLPMEAYEREREAINVATSTVLQAATEGDQRGVGATAGRALQAQQQAQAQSRTAMAGDLFNLEAATAEEESRLRDVLAQIDLGEASGAQIAAAEAADQRQQDIQAGISSATSAVQQGLSAAPLYAKTSGGRTANRMMKKDSDFQQKVSETINRPDVGAMGERDFKAFMGDEYTGKEIRNTNFDFTQPNMSADNFRNKMMAGVGYGFDPNYYSHMQNRMNLITR